MDYETARRHMVDNQLRTNKITDEALLAAMGELPREVFFPRAKRSAAYIDDDVEIAPGRYVMDPMVIGRLLQLAQPRSSDLALVVGAGSGYAAAVLSRCVASVVALESDAKLAERGVSAMRELGIDNVAYIVAPLAAGHPRQAPYDLILFDGAVPEIPQVIADQALEGGRIVAVLAEGGVGRASLAIRSGGRLSHKTVFDAMVGRLPGIEKPRIFAL